MKFMSEEIRRDFQKAIWSIVVAAVLSIGGLFFQSYVLQRGMTEQIDILKYEQQIIRQKIDLMQIQLERKVDRNTLDNCLQGFNLKLDKIADNIFKIQQNQINH